MQWKNTAIVPNSLHEGQPWMYLIVIGCSRNEEMSKIILLRFLFTIKSCSSCSRTNEG